MLTHLWVASSLLRWGGAIALVTGSHWVGVDLRHPDVILMVSRSFVSTSRVCGLLAQAGAQYSAAL